nr:alpha/beta hydrolase [Rugosimonospora africana]
MPSPPTELLGAPHGVELEYLATGTGRPVTVFAHGLGGGIADTRPLGSGVPGSKIFIQLRGHGRSAAPPGEWSYADLAADLAAVADFHRADQALGISLGAGALCRLLVDRPDRFRRLVFFLPAVLDTPRTGPSHARLTALLDAIGSGDRDRLAEVIFLEVPAALRATVAARAFVRERADRLLRDGLGAGLAGLTGRVAVPDATALAAVTAPALVIAAAGDELHPVPVAERLASLLPHAQLHVYDQPGVLWTARADLRERISAFLGAPD